MKNAMKKIMSLVLVAMILVSALPFAAAADSEMCNFWIELKLDGAVIDSQTVSVPVGTTMDEDAVKLYAENHLYGEYFGEGYTYVGCYDQGGKAGEEGYMGAGIAFETKKPVETEPAEPEMVNFWIELNVDGKHIDSQIVSVPMGTVMDEGTVKLYAEKHLYGKYFGNGYTYKGCYDFGGKAGVDGYIGAGIKFETKPVETTPNTPGTGNSYDANNGTTSTKPDSYSKFHYEVYLNIYTDTTVGTVKKTIKITDGIAADGKVTLNEVKNLVFNYYKANTSAGIQFDGLYPAKGNWVMDYVADKKYDTIEGLYEAASKDYVYINVMLTNATAISSGNADSSNPKTGDELYKAITVMAVSASALAVAFYFNKKRTVA